MIERKIGFWSYLVAGASNDGGEDSPGGVITGKAGLAHAGAVVNDKSGNILVTHLCFGRFGRWYREGVDRKGCSMKTVLNLEIVSLL